MMILPTTLSDHSPVTITMGWGLDRDRTRHWRMKPHSLLDPLFSSELEVAIEEFFEINTGSVSSQAILWESFKAYIRGIALSKENGILRTIPEGIAESKSKLSILEAQCSLLSTSETLASIGVELDTFRSLAVCEQKFLDDPGLVRKYGEGERPGRFLARLIRRELGALHIPGIERPDGSMAIASQDINSEFFTFYEALYSNSDEASMEEVRSYFDAFPLSALSLETTGSHDSTLTPEEFSDAIDSLSSGKAPGSDGIPIEFYKRYKALLLPHLIAL